ncbi:MAG: IclR family transcriptional regulator [Clostridiaceae bacterium]
MANSDGIIVKSVDHAISILECFSGSSAELKLSEIVAEMHLSKSTVYGLVNTLTTKGFLEQNPDTRGYRLGIKLYELGSLVHKRMDLRNDAKPFCVELSQKYNATVHLAFHYENEVVYIDKVDSPGSIIIYSQIGKRAPMHCTGVGKAIMAYLPKIAIDNYLAKNPLQKFTDYTITNPDLLMKELKLTRKRGYAVDNEEIEFGLRCIAAPIFSHKNVPIAAISISAPTARLPAEDIQTIASDVQFYGQQISQRLGYKVKE